MIYIKKIKFTLEVECHSYLPILKVLLIRNNMDLSISIYRSPVKLNTVITFNVLMSFSYKIAAFYLFLKMAFLVCSDIHVKNKINLIRNIFCTINKIKYHIIHHNSLEVPMHRFKKFQYIPVLYQRLKNYLIKFDIHVVAIYPPNLIIRLAVHSYPVPSEYLPIN